MLTDTLPTATAQLVERAREHLDPGAVAERVYTMTAIPSPTGEELGVATLIVDHLRAAGVKADVQSIDGGLANAVAHLGRAEKAPPRLLLYAPLDTAFSGNPAEDEAWLGPTPRPD